MRAANKGAQAEDSGETGGQTGRETKAEASRRKNAAKRARRMMRNQADAMPVVEAGDGPRELREVQADLVAPAPRGGLVETFQQPYLLRLIVSRQLAQMYAASLLGLLWSYIQPAMRFGIYYLVMGFILKLHEGFPYFAIHLFTGIVVVHYFGETWSGGTRSLWSNKGLIQKNRMPREIFPVAAMLVAAYHTLPQLIVLVLCCVISGWHITWTAIFAGLLGLGILVTFSMALALFFSALNVFYKDFQNIVQTMLQFMHFMVPMMYPFSRVYSAHEKYPILYQIYMANPVTQAVLFFQKLFWAPLTTKDLSHEFPPDLWVRGLITLAACCALLWLSQKFFSRVEGKFPERL
jgi:ABC-2 type transport system permease protein